MKAKGNKTDKLVSIPEKGLLSLVSNQLKDRILFPQKIEEAKAYLKKVKIANQD